MWRNTRLLRIGLRSYDLTNGSRPPANLVFLVDTSGSMNEPDKLPLVKAALRGLAGELRPDDHVSIIAYAGSAGIVLEPTSDKRFIDAALGCLEAGGSTAGGAGIALAYSTAQANFRPGAVNRIFLATDGDFNVGISDNRALEELVKRNRDRGITLTTLGFGTGNYNEAMMERIADVGNGNYAYIDSAMEARKVLGDELSATLVTVAKDVKVQVEFNPAEVSQYRLIGYENRALREEDFKNDAVDAGDIGAGHQVTALYEVVPAGGSGWTEPRRYAGNVAEARTSTGVEACFVKLRYKLPSEAASREISRPVLAGTLRGAQAPVVTWHLSPRSPLTGRSSGATPISATLDFRISSGRPATEGLLAAGVREAGSACRRSGTVRHFKQDLTSLLRYGSGEGWVIPARSIKRLSYSGAAQRPVRGMSLRRESSLQLPVHLSGY
jgi:Ca-activated chloride channel family protein